MEFKESSDEETLLKFSRIEQQINQINQQLDIIEKNIIEMSSLSIGLDELKESVGKEIFSPLGKGIFLRTKIISEKLNVDIGNGNFVQKSIDETKELIGEQIKKLNNVKEDLTRVLESINEEITKQILKEQNKKS